VSHWRKLGPKPEQHPSVGEICPGCRKPFIVGCYTTMVDIGPGGDVEQRRLKLRGWPYRAVVIEAHWGCVTGFNDDDSYPGA
jgi:hypothetical protein